MEPTGILSTVLPTWTLAGQTAVGLGLGRWQPGRLGALLRARDGLQGTVHLPR